MANHWEVDPKNGDYVMEGGAPKQTESLRIPAYYRMKIPRTKWMYAPNDKYGSLFWSVRKRVSTQDNSLLENMAADAIQPIVDDGRAIQAEVTTVAVARHGVGMSAVLTDSSAKPQTLVLPQI